MEEITAESLNKIASDRNSIEERLQKILYQLEDAALSGKFLFHTVTPYDKDIKKELEKRGFKLEKDSDGFVSWMVISWE